MALISAPLLVLLGSGPPGRGFLYEVAIALGFSGVMIMAVQFLLTARFRRAAAPFGIDVIYYFHRYAALTAFAAMLLHPILLVKAQPAYLSFLNPISAPWQATAGMASIGALVLLLATSFGRKQLHVEYDVWRYAHLFLAIAAVVLALAHVDGFSYYTAARPMQLVWPVLIAAWAASVVYVRLVRPGLLMRNHYRVFDVRPERGDAWTIELEPQGPEDFQFQAGQFAWLTLRSSPFAMKEHPFSVSSSPSKRRRIEFTIKELGDFTRTVKHTRPGEIAYVDGPYGAFTIERYDAPGFVFVAGGIGIAPVMSMLRSLRDREDPRPRLLFYAYRRWERLTFREEIDAMAATMPLRVVYVLAEPPPDWKGARGRITRELLENELPRQRQDREYFICGPEPMILSVENSLHQLGVPLARIHSELYELV